MGSIDILAVAPHPDDAELYCSGILLAAKHAGHSTGIIDLTHGELSTRGNPDLRKKETTTASAILHLDLRENLNIPDGDITNSKENRQKVALAFRTYRPKIVLLPWLEDRHPDHEDASRLVRDALFFSGIEKFAPGADAPPYRPRQAYFYQMATDFEPQVLVDISAHFETKMAAIAAYASQFFVEEAAAGEQQETYVSSRGFMESVVARSRRLGFLAGTTHAEGLRPYGLLPISARLLMQI